MVRKTVLMPRGKAWMNYVVSQCKAVLWMDSKPLSIIQMRAASSDVVDKQ